MSQGVTIDDISVFLNLPENTISGLYPLVSCGSDFDGTSICATVMVGSFSELYAEGDAGSITIESILSLTATVNIATNPNAAIAQQSATLNIAISNVETVF
ncbi:MAG: hypothetical protein AAF846_26630 [Chloroflexota bacterium]